MDRYLSHDYQWMFFLSHMNYLRVWADKKVFQFCVTCMRASGTFPMPHFCMEHVFYESHQTHVSSCNVTAYAPLFVCHRLNPVMASRLVAGLVVQVTLNRVPVCPGSGFTTCNRKWKWGSLKYKVCETRHRICMKGMLSVLVCLWSFVYRVNQDFSMISIPTFWNDIMLCMIKQPNLHSNSIIWIHERDTSVNEGPSPFTFSYMFHRRILLLQQCLNWKPREKALFSEGTF